MTGCDHTCTVCLFPSLSLLPDSLLKLMFAEDLEETLLSELNSAYVALTGPAYSAALGHVSDSADMCTHMLHGFCLSCWQGLESCVGEP